MKSMGALLCVLICRGMVLTRQLKKRFDRSVGRQLASVSDTTSGYIKLVEYDAYGRPSKTVTSLGVGGVLGNHYEKVTYDQYGRTYQVFDAARNNDNYTNNGVQHRYNDYGFYYQTVDAVYTNGSPRKVYHTITEMDVFGNVTGVHFGINVGLDNADSLHEKSLINQCGDLQGLPSLSPIR